MQYSQFKCVDAQSQAGDIAAVPARRDKFEADVADFRHSCGQRVRSLRKDRSWSQEELGERAELHRNHVGAIERGELNVTLDNLFRLAKALGVTPKDLFPG